LQKRPFYRRFRAIGGFLQQILSSKIFASEHCSRESTARAVAPRGTAAIHKIKRNDCYFFATGVMRIAVQIDSRLHCSMSPSTQARRAAMAKKRKTKAAAKKTAKKTKRRKKK
jgi:hypothetical protein